MQSNTSNRQSNKNNMQPNITNMQSIKSNTQSIKTNTQSSKTNTQSIISNTQSNMSNMQSSKANKQSIQSQHAVDTKSTNSRYKAKCFIPLDAHSSRALYFLLLSSDFGLPTSVFRLLASYLPYNTKYFGSRKAIAYQSAEIYSAI